MKPLINCTLNVSALAQQQSIRTAKAAGQKAETAEEARMKLRQSLPQPSGSNRTSREPYASPGEAYFNHTVATNQLHIKCQCIGPATINPHSKGCRTEGGDRRGSKDEAQAKFTSTKWFKLWTRTS